MFMLRGKAKTNISNTGPADTDASMFFKMMKNCKLFEIENEDYLYDDVILCRDKLHHSASSRVCLKDTKTNLNTMITLLKKFEDVQACKDAIDNIEKMLHETVMSMSVKTETISKMAKEALAMKKSALETDEKLISTNGFSSEETTELLVDTNKAIGDVNDPSTEANVFQGQESREDLRRENEMLSRTKQADEAENETSNDLVDPQNATDDQCDETTDEKSKEKFANYAKILSSADPDLQLCAAITKHLVPIVKKVAEKDKEMKKKVDELEIQELEDKNNKTEETQESENKEGEQLPCALFEGVDSDMELGQICKLRVTERVTERLFLTCCRISSEELLVADRINNKVYKLNNQYKLITSLHLDQSPYDVCHVAERGCAALLFAGKLAFIDIKDDMKLTNEVEIERGCSGLLCHSDRLYMIDSKCVYIYSLDGVLQRKLYESSYPNNSFRYIALSGDTRLIYLTCLYNGLITLDMLGHEVARYLDSDLTSAWGVSVDFAGNVLVCDSTSTHNIILKISPDGREKSATIENVSDKEGKVTVLFYDKETGLLLATGSSGTINILRLK